MFPVQVLGERLRLREFTGPDLTELQALCAGPDTQGQLLPAEPVSKEPVSKEVALIGAGPDPVPAPPGDGEDEPRSVYAFAVELRGHTGAIGLAGLILDAPDSGRIRLTLRPEAWGRGLGFELTNLLLLLAFEQLGLRQVSGSCEPENAESAKAMLRVGMTFEGRFAAADATDGLPDTLHYSISATEWRRFQTDSPF